MLDAMGRARIVKPWGADHADTRFAADAFDATNEIVGGGPFFYGHEIGNFNDAVGGKEASEEDVRVGEVYLLALRAVEFGRDGEKSAAFRIENRSEDGGRVEAGEAHEIDRSIQRDERDGVQVANDGVVFDRFNFRLLSRHSPRPS